MLIVQFLQQSCRIYGGDLGPHWPITRWMNVKGMPAGHFVQKDTSFFQFSREET